MRLVSAAGITRNFAFCLQRLDYVNTLDLQWRVIIAQ